LLLLLLYKGHDKKIVNHTTSIEEKTVGNELSRSLMGITTCTYLMRCGIFGVWHAQCLMTQRYIKHANSVRWLLFYFPVLLATPLPTKQDFINMIICTRRHKSNFFLIEFV